MSFPEWNEGTTAAADFVAKFENVYSPPMHRIRVIDSHTEGGPDLGGGSMAERPARFQQELDRYRSAVVNEPRGSDGLRRRAVQSAGRPIVRNQVGVCIRKINFQSNPHAWSCTRNSTAFAIQRGAAPSPVRCELARVLGEGRWRPMFGQILSERLIDDGGVAKDGGHVRFEQNQVRAFLVGLVVLPGGCTSV
jgi:hypothetical protein